MFNRYEFSKHYAYSHGHQVGYENGRVIMLIPDGCWHYVASKQELEQMGFKFKPQKDGSLKVWVP